jgi:hypothetical protein
MRVVLPRLLSSGMLCSANCDSLSKRLKVQRFCGVGRPGRSRERVARQRARIMRPDSMVFRMPKGMELSVGRCEDVAI